MTPNYGIVFLAALIPLLVGFVWYHPAVLGQLWMRESGVLPEQLQSSKGKMLRIFGLTYVYSLLLASILISVVIHQQGVLGLIGGSEVDALPSYHAFMADYGDRYRTFGHGAMHGFFASLFLSLALVGITALFERKSARYILVHVGYWTLTGALMGGVLCAWL